VEAAVTTHKRAGSIQVKERTAVVTGGASGIGAGISRRLAHDGASVAVFDIHGAQELAGSIESAGGSACGLTVDVTDHPAVAAAADEVQARLRRPTILVNCAGRSAWGAFLGITREQWNAALAVNLTSAFNCCQLFIPGMLEESWGRIVNISSSSIHMGAPSLAPYVAAKMGIVGLTKSLSLEFAPHGITVNAVAPGFVDTPGMRRTEARGFINVEESAKRGPVQRVGQREDIANACAFLVSDAAEYITGQILPVNVGRASTDP
jgi:NAD(P)-dependent dehydrogenase (short-subunit alcohol dehydrogenase family)